MRHLGLCISSPARVALPLQLLPGISLALDHPAADVQCHRGLELVPRCVAAPVSRLALSLVRRGRAIRIPHLGAQSARWLSLTP